MSFKARINSFRRKIMQRLTRNIGNRGNHIRLPEKTSLRILVVRPNHRLGNQLLLTPLIQDLENTFPTSKIDLLVKGDAAELIFRNYESIGKIIKLPRKPFSSLPSYLHGWLKLPFSKYELVINTSASSSSGRIATLISRSDSKIFQFSDKIPDKHMARRPVINFRQELKKTGFPTPNTAIPAMDIRLSAQEISDGKNLLEQLTKNRKPPIALFTYATGRKKYSSDFWIELIGELQRKFPGFQLIEILPVENVSAVNFELPSFYSKDIREIASVIRNCRLFIGADSGMMHLAEASHTPTIGLFQVTSAAVYEPYGQGSIAIDTRVDGIADVIRHAKSVLEESQPSYA